MIPSFRGLLVVDAEGFSRHPDAELPGLHAEIRRIVQETCERSGLLTVWQSLRVLQSTGDGLFAILPLEAMTSLIHPFSDHLQDILAETAPSLRARGVRLRLRVALHVGLVDDEDPETAGVSGATNDVHRLLDCQPLRDALLGSAPDVTFVATIVSSEVFDAYVRGGHTKLRPTQFTRVRATVKQFDRPAYLYIPVPSTREAGSDPAPDSSDHPSTPPADPHRSHVSVTGDGSQNVIGSHVRGGIRQKRS
jgi:hypothetical protein